MQRNQGYIKRTVTTDYQPDICKDYAKTGFCGFGDSCKFLHDRYDYKRGIEPEEDDDKNLIKDNEDEEDENYTDCPICKEPFKNPIETKCKHYFCVDCAENKCTDKCYTCQTSTSGIFKNAKKILATKEEERLNKKKG